LSEQEQKEIDSSAPKESPAGSVVDEEKNEVEEIKKEEEFDIKESPVGSAVSDN
jgi:hypothetical protein